MATASKEKFFAKNTLSVLLIAMENHRVVIETKNQNTITGLLHQSDGYGNLLLRHAKLITLDGKRVKAEEMHVKGSAVKYVHLPDSIDPLNAIKNELSRKKPTPQMPRKYKKT